MGGEWRDDRPEAQPDFWSFRPQSDHPHWIDLAMNDIADSIRGSGAEQPDWQRWTVITDDLPLAAVYPPGLYFEGWSSAPHRMDPPHREPSGFALPLQYVH